MENKHAVIGTFSGKCADATVTNENGLDITRPVWENVFNSDTYKEAIELGHLIGFLGHPEDPGCQDFRNACIVMKEGHIDDNGEVFGEFDLIDTPVGQVVKTFIDAGVTFGISVRGAGDIIGSSVDPDTFVFRGFDLVTFPAYKDAIPEFTEIAASTDLHQKEKYQKICSSVKANLKNITSSEALEVIKCQFPEQSDTYKEIEQREEELTDINNNDDIINYDEYVKDIPDLNVEKIEGLTQLLLSEKVKCQKLKDEISRKDALYQSQRIKSDRKLNSIMRIVASQEKRINEAESIYASETEKLKAKQQVLISANTKLKNQLSTEKSTNLQYISKIEASDNTIADLQENISELSKKLDKTVIEASQNSDIVSDLEAKISTLNKQIVASQQLIDEYQDAYASLYSKAVGINLSNISVTASTSVADLQKKINSSSAQIAVSEEFDEPQQLLEDIDDDNFLITI